jgi:hypothetical protein
MNGNAFPHICSREKTDSDRSPGNTLIYVYQFSKRIATVITIKI